MKKSLLSSVVTIAVTLSASAVFAAAWNVPTNVRVVQKSNTDTTGRIYGNIQSAINSITNASATNRYLVKVMPGVYDLGTAALQMKEYVDVEGSGPEATLVTSTNYNADNVCATGTVVMANNMTLRNIKVENKAPDLGGEYGYPVAAVVFNEVTAKVDGISVVTGNDTTPGGKNIGICTNGPTANATINNSYIESHNVIGQSGPVRYFGGNITVENSKLVGFCNGGSVQLFNNDSGYIGKIKVNNSTLEATGEWVTAFTSDGVFDVVVTNSTIALHAPSCNPLNGFSNYAVMDNTKITVDGTCDFNGEPEKFKIANSQIPSVCTGLAGSKLFNNHDENYNQIPNQ